MFQLWFPFTLKHYVWSTQGQPMDILATFFLACDIHRTCVPHLSPHLAHNLRSVLPLFIPLHYIKKLGGRILFFFLSFFPLPLFLLLWMNASKETVALYSFVPPPPSPFLCVLGSPFMTSSFIKYLLYAIPPPVLLSPFFVFPSSFFTVLLFPRRNLCII